MPSPQLVDKSRVSITEIELNVSELRIIHSTYSKRFCTPKKRRIAIASIGSCLLGVILAVAIIIPLQSDRDKNTEEISSTLAINGLIQITQASTTTIISTTITVTTFTSTSTTTVSTISTSISTTTDSTTSTSSTTVSTTSTSSTTVSTTSTTSTTDSTTSTSSTTESTTSTTSTTVSTTSTTSTTDSTTSTSRTTDSTTSTTSTTDSTTIISSLLFTQNYTSSGNITTKCLQWTSFVTQLTVQAYRILRMYGSSDPTGIALTNSTYVSAIAAALRTSTSYGPVISDNRTWRVFPCGGGYELTADGSICQCRYPGYAFRACYDAPRFGGLNNSTCNGPAQSIFIEFQF